ncbi:hypothetical protein BDV23DRAFT_143763, partial [Aspergillus alliaceus]
MVFHGPFRSGTKQFPLHCIYCIAFAAMHAMITCRYVVVDVDVDGSIARPTHLKTNSLSSIHPTTS